MKIFVHTPYNHWPYKENNQKKVLVTPNDGVSLTINIFEMVINQVPFRFLSPKNYLSYTTVWTKMFSKTKIFSSRIITSLLLLLLYLFCISYLNLRLHWHRSTKMLLLFLTFLWHQWKYRNVVRANYHWFKQLPLPSTG